jgi:hypothetical protein
MSRRFKRKHIRLKHASTNVPAAVDAMRKSETDYLKAGELYDLPQTILERLAKKAIAQALAVQISLDRTPTLP